MRKLFFAIGILLTVYSCNPTKPKSFDLKYSDKYVFVGHFKGDQFVIEDTAAFLQPDSTWKVKDAYKDQVQIIK